MTEYDTLRKATYLFYNKLGKRIPYETLINLVDGNTCWRGTEPNFTHVYLVTAWIGEEFCHANYSLERLRKMTLPKKYQEVKRTEPFDNCAHYEYHFKRENDKTIYGGKLCCDGSITKEDVIRMERLDKFPWFEIKQFTPTEWIEELLSKEI